MLERSLQRPTIRSWRTGLGKGVPAVVFWSDTEGAFAGATLGATNLSWNHDANRAYYRKHALASGMIADGKQGPVQQALSSL